MATGGVRIVNEKLLREISVPEEVLDEVTEREREELVDDLVCLVTPTTFFGISEWYERFPQVSDETVRSFLAGARRQEA